MLGIYYYLLVLPCFGYGDSADYNGGFVFLGSRIRWCCPSLYQQLIELRSGGLQYVAFGGLSAMIFPYSYFLMGVVGLMVCPQCGLER